MKNLGRGGGYSAMMFVRNPKSGASSHEGVRKMMLKDFES